jgi:hypothetical protein
LQMLFHHCSTCRQFCFHSCLLNFAAQKTLSFIRSPVCRVQL